MKKMIFIVGALIMLLLVGCDNDEVYTNNHDPANSYENNDNALDTHSNQNIVRPERPGELFPELLSMHRIVAQHGDGFFVFATTENAPENYNFYFCNINDSSVTIFNQAFTEDFHVSTFQAMADGTLIVAGWYIQRLPYENAFRIDDSAIHVYHVRDNEAIHLLGLPQAGIWSIALDELNGQMYILAIGHGADTIRVHTLAGYFLYEVVSDRPIQDILFSNQDRKLYVMQPSAADMNILYLDETGRQLHITANLQDGAAGVTFHQSSTHAFYAIQGSSVLGYNSETGLFTNIFDLTRHGISGWVPFLMEADGRYIVNVVDIATNMPRVLWLSMTEEHDGPVQTLRLGKFEAGRDWLLEELISIFNFYNPQYLVEIVDYSVHGREATTRLHLDVITGNAPDIFLLSGVLYGDDLMPFHYFLPIHQYISSGVLLDLAPFKHRDLNFSDYWEGAMQSLFIGDASYFAVPSFSLYAFVGNNRSINAMAASDFGGLLDFFRNDFQSDNPGFTSNISREKFVLDMVMTNMTQFVDYNLGTVSFDSDEFISLLETAYLFSPSDSWAFASIARGLRQLTLLPLRDFDDLESLAAVLDGDIQTKGLPGHPSGVAMIPTHMFGVFAGTQNVEGAWGFIREMYEFEGMHNLIGSNFPINRASFFSARDRYIVNATETIISLNEENIPGHTFIDFNDDGSEIIFSVPPIAIEQVSEVAGIAQALVEQVDRVFIIDHSIMNIISEELTTFFNSNRTAEDTARVIQSRTQTLLWEMLR